MRRWTVRLAALSLVVLSILLVVGGRLGGFLACAGASYSEVNGRAQATWMRPTACSMTAWSRSRSSGSLAWS
jgi:hypothetical protein